VFRPQKPIRKQK